MDVLSQIADATAAVTGTAGPAVVTIGRSGRGSGVVIAAGRVLTNAHNLRDRTTQVTFHDGRSSQGAAAGIDIDGDLVVLQADTGDVTPVTWGDPGQLRPGTGIFALARGAGAGFRTTFGTVSALGQTFRGPRGRRLGGAFEHTAPLARGSSGGPVTDAEGRLLGVNTSRRGQGFYIALAADETLRSRVEAMSRGEVVQRPQLGVGLAPSVVANRLRRAVGLAEREGLLVQHVADDSPAQRSGLEAGDLLVAAARRPLARIDDLMEALDSVEAGSSLTLTVVRGVDERTVTVTLQSDAPPDEGQDSSSPSSP